MTTTRPTLALTGASGPLSSSIIPAVPGKFYAYPSEFTQGNPLYALMDCKANKSRMLAQVQDLGREVHLHVEIDGSIAARISSIKTAHAAGLLGSITAEFDDVWVAPANIAIEDFYALCARRDSKMLAEVCEAVCHGRETSIDVMPDTIVAVMTSAGKRGLFLVTEITPSAVRIDACHVLLT